MDNFDYKKYLAEGKLLKEEEIDVLGNEFLQDIQDEMKRMYSMDVDMDTIKDWVQMYYIDYNLEYEDKEGDVDYEGNVFGSEDYESEKKELVFDTGEREDFYMYLKDDLAEGRLKEDKEEEYYKEGNIAIATSYMKKHHGGRNLGKMTDKFLEILGQKIVDRKFDGDERKAYQELVGINEIGDEGKLLKENIDFPEMEDEFEGAMDAMVVEPEVYLKDILNASADDLVSDDYYEVMNAVEQGVYSKDEAVKLAKSWAKEKLYKRGN